MTVFTRESLDKYISDTIILESKLRELQSQTQEACEVGGNVWHDNASYEDLKNQISGLDWQIKERYVIINEAEVVEYPKKVDRVCLGSNVTYLQNGEKREIQIVAFGEENPREGRVNYQSPLARALIGKNCGEIIELQLREGPKSLEILAIQPIN